MSKKTHTHLHNQEPISYNCEFEDGTIVPSKFPDLYNKIEEKEERENCILIPYATLISNKYKWFWELPDDIYHIARYNTKYKSYNLSTETGKGSPIPKSHYRLCLKRIGNKFDCQVFEMDDEEFYE